MEVQFLNRRLSLPRIAPPPLPHERTAAATERPGSGPPHPPPARDPTA